MSTKKPKRSTADRFMILNAFVDFSLRDLPRAELAVWMTLYRDTRNGTAKVSQKYIAARCGMSDRTVRRAIDRLTDRGLLAVRYQGGLRQGASTYKVFPVSREQLEKL